MPEYPRGTVAFLFTDIEGSTRRWETQQQAMWAAVERHFDLLRVAIESQGGVLFKTVGDAVQAAFPSVPNAVAAAVTGQSALRHEDWGELGPLRVRMAIHAGDATPHDGDYLAPALNRLARVLSSGYGDQILLTEVAHAALGAALPPGCDLADLGAHRLRDLLQAEHIYQLRGPGLAAEFPPLKSLDRHLHNLPAQPTALLGREAEIASARTLLDQDGVRLVTLTGPGGTGKTRLGVQVAAESIDAFADGVWFVPLAAIAEPGLVIPAIAHPLGVREGSGEPVLQSLQDYLRSRHALLLLDNFEHVTAAAPDIAALLAACPKVKVLATSREPLRIRGERELPVPPLALPQPRHARGLSTPELLAFPAIRLFVDRAQTVKSGFDLTEDNAADVVAICQKLDGLPLAIELAAARARILTPAQLLARLDKRLKLLTGGQRDLPARQQTLRAAIEWSYDLLNADEQILVARLAVFAGGCTLEAAEAVCADVGGHTLDVLDGIESLVQKSLIRQMDSSDGVARFTMLETIREFALERLDALSHDTEVRRIHATFFLDLAEKAERELTGSNQVPWLDQLGYEHDNFRTALGWLDQPVDREVRLRLAAALWRFWWMRGHITEGRAWLTRALNQPMGPTTEDRANALSGAGILAESQGDYEMASDLHQEALSIWRKLDETIGIAASLTNLGIIAHVHGEYDRAINLQEQALSLWREADDERGVIGALNELGRLELSRGNYDAAEVLLQECHRLSRNGADVAALGTVLESLGMLAFYKGELDLATRRHEESLRLRRVLGETRTIASSVVNLAEIVHHQGDLADAEGKYKEALTLFRDLGEKRGMAFALFQLGKLSVARDDIGGASSLFAESLELRRQVQETPTVLECLHGLAQVLILGGNAARGVRVLAATVALRTDHGFSLDLSTRKLQGVLLNTAECSLGAMTLAEQWTLGEKLSLDEAIAEALAASGNSLEPAKPL